jgi:hypothetical protein
MDNIKSEPERNRKILIEPEEYDALMSELPPPEEKPDPPELEKRVRKIELYMLIIIIMILAIFFFYRH